MLSKILTRVLSDIMQNQIEETESTEIMEKSQIKKYTCKMKKMWYNNKHKIREQGQHK